MARPASYLKLGEVASFRNGLNFSKDSHGNGCLLVGIPDFGNRFTPDYDALDEINPAGIAKPDDYLKEGDIVFVRSNGNKALVGRSLYVDREVKALFSGFCIRARIFDDRLDPKFCAYYAKTATFRASISSSAGTNINNLNQGVLGDAKIPMFAKNRQRGIVSLLEALDRKIELSTRISKELEGMAKLLYDYWFVQFDFPISAARAAAIGKPRLAGKPYRASGCNMVYNEALKREIPEGWRAGSLLDVAVFTNGIACQKYPPVDDATLRVIKIREMHAGFTRDSDIVTTKVPAKAIIKNGDLLFSWSASLEVMIWTGGCGVLNQHIFKVTSHTHPRAFCYFVLLDYLGHFRMMADLRKTTMGHITSEHLEQSQIAIPNGDVAEAFEAAANPIVERMVKAHEESLQLAALRDWLLPMLMNGQVSVG